MFALSLQVFVFFLLRYPNNFNKVFKSPNTFYVLGRDHSILAKSSVSERKRWLTRWELLCHLLRLVLFLLLGPDTAFSLVLTTKISSNQFQLCKFCCLLSNFSMISLLIFHCRALGKTAFVPCKAGCSMSRADSQKFLMQKPKDAEKGSLGLRDFDSHQ